jgi:hypothetical protein
MPVLETCRRTGRSGLEFVSQALRAFGNPLLPIPVLLTPRSSSPLWLDGLCVRGRLREEDHAGEAEERAGQAVEIVQCCGSTRRPG